MNDNERKVGHHYGKKIYEKPELVLLSDIAKNESKAYSVFEYSGFTTFGPS